MYLWNLVCSIPFFPVRQKSIAIIQIHEYIVAVFALHKCSLNMCYFVIVKLYFVFALS